MKLLFDYRSIRNRIASIYSYILIFGFIMLMINHVFTVPSDAERIAQEWFFAIFLLIIGLFLKLSIQKNWDKAQLGLYSAIFIFFYILSYTISDPTKVGITRYLLFLTILSIVSFYFDLKKGVWVLFSFLVLQSVRATLIELELIQLSESPWNGYQFLLNSLWLVIFCYIIFSQVQNQFHLNVDRVVKKNQENESYLHQLTVLKEKIESSLNRQDAVFQQEFKEIRERISWSKSQLSKKEAFNKESIEEWHRMLDEMDQHMRTIDRLTEE